MTEPIPKPPELDPNNVVMQFYLLGRRDILRSIIETMRIAPMNDRTFTAKEIQVVMEALLSAAPKVDIPGVPDLSKVPPASPPK